MNKIKIGIVAGLIIVLFFFLLLHGNILLNRYTDSWCHIAMADEFAKTGHFAKDPFFKKAPDIAQFGLMNYLNGKISLWANIETAKGFIFLTALGSILFLICSFCSGYFLHLNIVEGFVCLAASWIIYAKFLGYNISGFGLPFFLALALFFSVMSYLLSVNGNKSSQKEISNIRELVFLRKSEALWIGIITGVIFSLHAFVGLMSLLFIGSWMAIGLVTAFLRGKTKAEITRILIFCVSFSVVSWKWLWLRFSLRPILAKFNSHFLTNYFIDKFTLSMAFLAIILLVLGLYVSKKYFLLDEKVQLIILLSWSLLVLLFCLPKVNLFIASQTGSFMAERLPMFIPYGIIYTVCSRIIFNLFAAKSRIDIPTAIVLFILITSSLFLVKRALLLEAYLFRTRDYDRNHYDYLREKDMQIFRGETLLSDPFSSYYARGMLGTYAIVAPYGHSSPAIDPEKNNQMAKQALTFGPSCLKEREVDLVLVDKVNTPPFSGKTAQQIVEAWRGFKWHILRETQEFVLLVKGKRSE